jgi:1-acyl-sn-glycerol-3-phosphate acyltransferase
VLLGSFLVAVGGLALGEDRLLLWLSRAKFMITVTRTQIKLAGPTRAAEPCKQPIMYLANHRSWADFFVDLYLLGGRGVIMSRYGRT